MDGTTSKVTVPGNIPRDATGASHQQKHPARGEDPGLNPCPNMPGTKPGTLMRNQNIGAIDPAVAKIIVQSNSRQQH